MASRISYSTLYPNTHVKGFEAVMGNLNAEIMKIKDASLKGLIKAAIEIRRDTEKTPEKTPVDLGNLRASWFVVTARGKQADDQWNTGFRNIKGEKRQRSGGKAMGDAATMIADRASAVSEMSALAKSALTMGKEVLIMGYSANYAVYVHENLEQSVKWKRSGSGPKWFQNSVNRNSGKILQIIKENVQIR